MNKAYRLLWNEQLNAWCVAPECASGRGKRTSRRIMAALGAALLAATAGPLTAADLAPGALPSGGTVAAGQAAAERLGLRFEHVHTGLGQFDTAVTVVLHPTRKVA